MRREKKLKGNAVGIYVLKAHGQGHLGLFMVIMIDMKQLILSHFLAIILVVMAAVGNFILLHHLISYKL